MSRRYLQEYFFDPPRGRMAKNPGWKYGMLALCGGLLAIQVWLFLSFPLGDSYMRLMGLVVPTMLLLNHLTAFFYFGRWLTFPFRLFSTAFLIVGSVYLFWCLFIVMQE